MLEIDGKRVTNYKFVSLFSFFLPSIPIISEIFRIFAPIYGLLDLPPAASLR